MPVGWTSLLSCDIRVGSAFHTANPVTRHAVIIGGKAQAAAHGFVHFQAEGFVRAAVVEVGTDFGIDAVMLAEVADGAAAIVRLQTK